MRSASFRTATKMPKRSSHLRILPEDRPLFPALQGSAQEMSALTKLRTAMSLTSLWKLCLVCPCTVGSTSIKSKLTQTSTSRTLVSLRSPWRGQAVAQGEYFQAKLAQRDCLWPWKIPSSSLLQSFLIQMAPHWHQQHLFKTTFDLDVVLSFPENFWLGVL